MGLCKRNKRPLREVHLPGVGGGLALAEVRAIRMISFRFALRAAGNLDDRPALGDGATAARKTVAVDFIEQGFATPESAV